MIDHGIMHNNCILSLNHAIFRFRAARVTITTVVNSKMFSRTVPEINGFAFFYNSSGERVWLLSPFYRDISRQAIIAIRLLGYFYLFFCCRMNLQQRTDFRDNTYKIERDVYYIFRRAFSTVQEQENNIYVPAKKRKTHRCRYLYLWPKPIYTYTATVAFVAVVGLNVKNFR